MKVSTIKVFEAAMLADDTVTPAERRRILKLAQNGEATPAQTDSAKAPRLYSREQAAELLGGRTTRFVDLLCRRGLLTRFTAPGSVRAIGITASSLNQFLGINA